MAEKFFSERNLKFMLYEVLDAESLTKVPRNRYKDDQKSQ